MASQERLLSAKQAAQQLGISTKTLYKFCRSGLINYIPVPRIKTSKRNGGPDHTFKFHQAALDLFIAQRTVKAALRG